MNRSRFGVDIKTVLIITSVIAVSAFLLWAFKTMWDDEIEGFHPAKQVRHVEIAGSSEPTTQYGYLGDDIGMGNPASQSGRVNAGTPSGPSLLERARQTGQSVYAKRADGGEDVGRFDSALLPLAPVVLQGTPLPLDYETRASKIDTPLVFPFLNDRCSPSCCPSTYTCDQGCLCNDRPAQ